MVDPTTQMLKILKGTVSIGIKKKGEDPVLYDRQVVRMEQGCAPPSVAGLKRRRRVVNTCKGMDPGSLVL